MPIENVIDEQEKLIYSTCRGLMSLRDFDEYIQRIWGDAKYYGFSELFDSTCGDWTDFDYGYLFAIAESAAQLTTIDPNTKLAWVVLEGKQKELTEFYKDVKVMLPVNSRKLMAFYSKQEALAWLKS